MKIRLPATCSGLILITMFSGTSLVYSAPPEAAPKAGAQVGVSNATPRSVFTVPSNFSEGRDPFYPNARYMFGFQPIPTPTMTPGADQLHLDGISGTADHKLAMINFHTMAQGETNDVNLVSGRIRIRCVEIKNQSVVVEVIGGERRELHLRD